MTFRERYLESLLFGKPDRTPLLPGVPRESTLRAWEQQGMPQGAFYFDVLIDELGLPDMPSGYAVIGHGFAATSNVVSLAMLPMFEEKILEHRSDHYLVQDWMGAITEISDEFDVTYIRQAKDFVTRKWHKFPVENREDWERMKERYDPDSPARFPESFDELVRSLRERDELITIQVNGPFWQLREWCGFENLCMLFVEDPEFVGEMVDFWAQFVSEMLDRIHTRVSIDRLGISEDMAYKAHSMISPHMCRQFLLPCWGQWVSQVKAAGCRLIDMDSDGYIGELIPLWIEAGINVCSPIEVAAHNDVVQFRREFGRKMGYLGAIDKRAIAAGGKVMREEVIRVVPPLLKEGGHIPGCDHGVPPDISWPDYVGYSRLLAQLTGWL